MFLRQDRDTSDKRLWGNRVSGWKCWDEMILNVRGLNVITDDSIVVWPRSRTTVSRGPSGDVFVSCEPRRVFRRKPSPWSAVSTAHTSAASSAANATSASSILKRSPLRWAYQCGNYSAAMKIVREETLLSCGQYAASAEWKTTRENLYKAIREVDWHGGRDVHDLPRIGKGSRQGNGVTRSSWA